MSITAERSALKWSIAVSVALGSVALVWGMVADSRVLVFDGVYLLIGIVLSVLSLAASRAAVSEPTAEYPFGMRAVTPLAIGVQGAALLGTLVYAVIDSTLALVEGGTGVDPMTVFSYGILTSIVSGVVTAWLTRWGRRIDSELVLAEAAGWRAGTVLSLVFALGGLTALLLQDRYPVLVHHTDPVLVLIACVGLVPVPVRMVRNAARELLEAAPSRELREHIDAAIAQVGTEFGLGRVVTRATKLGGRLYLEADFIVEPGSWEVDEEDQVRRALIDLLSGLDYEVWANIELTTDPQLAE